MRNRIGQKMRKKLRKARKEKGLTQQQVADQIGISLVYYQKIEQGSRTGDFEIWDSLSEIQKNMGFSAGNISHCCSGKRRIANGFSWKFEEV